MVGLWASSSLCRAALPISCPTVAPRPPTLGTQKESHTYPLVTVDCDSLLSPVPSLSRVVVKLRPDKAQNHFDNLSPFAEQNLNSSRPHMSFSVHFPPWEPVWSALCEHLGTPPPCGHFLFPYAAGGGPSVKNTIPFASLPGERLYSPQIWVTFCSMQPFLNFLLIIHNVSLFLCSYNFLFALKKEIHLPACSI